MGSQSTWRWAIAISALMLTTACGGQATPEASSSASAPSPTADPAPSTSSPTSSTPAIDPNIPAAARAHTPAGAEAFATYFISQVNKAWTAPQAGLIPAISESSCKTCADFESTAASLAAKKRRYSREVITTQALASGALMSNGLQDVDIRFRQEAIPVVDARGATVETTPRTKGVGNLLLRWNGRQWVVSEFKASAVN